MRDDTAHATIRQLSTFEDFRMKSPAQNRALFETWNPIWREVSHGIRELIEEEISDETNP